MNGAVFSGGSGKNSFFALSGRWKNSVPCDVELRSPFPCWLPPEGYCLAHNLLSSSSKLAMQVAPHAPSSVVRSL